jgi:hypothetical protein
MADDKKKPTYSPTTEKMRQAATDYLADDKLMREGRNTRPGGITSRGGIPEPRRTTDIELLPQRDADIPQMRAPTNREKINDFFQSLFESAAKQPISKIGALTGSLPIQAWADSFTTPDTGIRTGEMPGGPGKGVRGVFGSKPQNITNIVKDIPQLPHEFNRTASPRVKDVGEVVTDNWELDRQAQRGKQFDEMFSDPKWEQNPTARKEYIERRVDPTADEHNAAIKAWDAKYTPEGRMAARNKHQINIDDTIPDMQVVDDIGPRNNASGDSMASSEAMSRMSGMKNRGETYAVRQGGTTRPLIGPEAVDYSPRAGQEYGILDANGLFKLLQRGGR